MMASKSKKKRSNRNPKPKGTENNCSKMSTPNLDQSEAPGQFISQDEVPEYENGMGAAASLMPTAIAVVYGPARPPQLGHPEPRSMPNHHEMASQIHDDDERWVKTTAANTNGFNSSSRPENENLKAELDSVYRRLHKAEADFEKLQTEKLQSIDRFQPEFDPTIIAKVSSIEQKISSLVTFLCKRSGADKSAEEGRALAAKIWNNRFNRDIVEVDPKNKELRRKALKSMTWMFLQDELFSSPFLCYGEEIGSELSGIFRTLYPIPHHHAESVKWRCLTVQQLEASKDPRIHQPDNVTCQQLQKKFQLLTNDIGYDIKETDLSQKTRPLLEASIMLAKLFAGQRAIFEFFDPPKDLWFKEIDDIYCTNIDAASDDDNQVEESGEVAFVVSPALLKRGNGMGEHLDKKAFLKKAFVHLASGVLVGEGFER